jgi:hypothetical protein
MAGPSTLPHPVAEHFSDWYFSQNAQEKEQTIVSTIWMSVA